MVTHCALSLQIQRLSNPIVRKTQVTEADGFAWSRANNGQVVAMCNEGVLVIKPLERPEEKHAANPLS
jgi:hypothetical protein